MVENIKHLSQSIVLSSLLVGTIIIGRKYYERWLCNKWIKVVENDLNSEYEKSYIIDYSNENKNSKSCLSELLLKITSKKIDDININSNGNIKKLNSFGVVDNNLVYEFEDKYVLTLNNNLDNNKIIYSIHTPSFYLLKEVEDKNKKELK
jgi:hypothetical protein